MVGFCLVINPKMLVSVKDVIQYRCCSRTKQDISITPQMHSNFSQIHLYVGIMGLGEWRKSPRLGKPQNAGLASSICKPALVSAQFASQAMCLDPNILFSPRSGNMACPGSQGKHGVCFCRVMFG